VRPFGLREPYRTVAPERLAQALPAAMFRWQGAVDALRRELAGTGGPLSGAADARYLSDLLAREARRYSVRVALVLPARMQFRFDPSQPEAGVIEALVFPPGDAARAFAASRLRDSEAVAASFRHVAGVRMRHDFAGGRMESGFAPGAPEVTELAGLLAAHLLLVVPLLEQTGLFRLAWRHRTATLIGDGAAGMAAEASLPPGRPRPARASLPVMARPPRTFLVPSGARDGQCGCLRRAAAASVPLVKL
jgi:hypothetical protein